MSDKPTNPIKAAKEARERKLKMFFKMRPKENKHWSLSEIAEFAGNKCTIEEIKEAAGEQKFTAKILIKPNKVETSE